MVSTWAYSKSCVYRIRSLQLELSRVAVPFDSPSFFGHCHVTLYFYICLYIIWWILVYLFEPQCSNRLFIVCHFGLCILGIILWLWHAYTEFPPLIAHLALQICSLPLYWHGLGIHFPHIVCYRILVYESGSEFLLRIQVLESGLQDYCLILTVASWGVMCYALWANYHSFIHWNMMMNYHI